jgi:ethanolamine utilization microcompartment shell protein EutL
METTAEAEKNRLVEMAIKASRLRDEAIFQKEAGKTARRKTTITRSATEVSLGLRAQEALTRATKAEENYRVLWELCRYIYAGATNNSSSASGEALTNIILYGDEFEAYVKSQKDSLDAMLYNLRRQISNKQRTEAMRKAGKYSRAKT